MAVNSGGPYGSSVLAKVQADSQRVWSQVTGDSSESGRFASWKKASLLVEGFEPGPDGQDRWTVSPLNCRGEVCGGPFSFS